MLTIIPPSALLPAIAALAALYFVAGKLGLLLALVHPSASAVWPPTGIALAALLVVGPRVWPGVLLGAFAVNVTTAGTVLTSLGIATGNTLEAVIGAWLVIRFANGPRAFDRPQDVLRFALFAATFSTAISATVGVASLVGTGVASPSDFGPIWLTWWLGDLTGALVIAPPLVLLAGGTWPNLRPHEVAEAATVLGALVAVALVVFAGYEPVTLRYYPLEYLTLPLLVWVAFRFGPRLSALSVALLAAIAVWGTLRGGGPFAWDSQNESLLLLQAFMSVAALTAMVLAAAVAERQRTEAERVRLLSQERAARVEAESLSLRLAAVLQQIPAGVAIIDAATGRVTANPAARRLVLNDVECLDDWRQLTFVGPNGTRYRDEELPVLRALAGETVHAFEMSRVMSGGGAVTLMVNAVPVLDSGGEVSAAVVAFHDISQRKSLEQLKDQFLSIAAHELKTPITAIRGNTQLVLRQVRSGQELTGRQVRLLETVEERTKFMAGMINELLDLSRIETGQLTLRPAPYDVALVLEGVVALQRGLHPDTPYTLRGTEMPVIMSVDPERLEQVFTNLLDNAAKYSDEGRPVSVTLTENSDTITVMVEDNGIGIPAEDLPHLFERHFRASNVDRGPAGLGLGLYLAGEIIRRHGGTIAVESVEGHGSTFTVTLPRGGSTTE